MKVRESKADKNQQDREVIGHVEKARHLLRTKAKLNRAGFVILNKSDVDDIDDQLISAHRLLRERRNGY